MYSRKDWVTATSYILAAAGILAVLSLHLLHGLFAAILVYMLVHLAQPLVGKHFAGHRGKLVATAGLAVLVVACVSGFGLWIISMLHRGGGIDAIWVKIAETIESANAVLPPWLPSSLPSNGPEVKAEAVHWLREHAPELRLLGKEAGVALAHILIGMILGAMLAVQEVASPGSRKPLSEALTARIHHFYESFHSVFVAQGKIALINAGLTGIYILAVLPLMGIHLPFGKTMVLITALVGLLPVVGNLISNSIIVLISLSVSPFAAAASLVFLIVLHKAEYFLNARIVGGEINAKAWEILLAMVLMEALFGFGGVAIAPVLYAYIKAELMAADLV
jgi:predicted PurR-regulated permease PerM